MTKGGIVKETRVIEEYSKPTNPAKPLSSLMHVISKLLRSSVVSSIGIASPGRVDSSSGKVLYATPNLKNWSGIELSKVVEKEFGLPTFVLNDGKAAALAEAHLRGIKNLVMLTIGTGLGGGVVINGRLIFGKDWQAGEFGHTILHANGRKCNCGKRGCAEQYISMKILHYYSGIKDRRELLARFLDQDPRVIQSCVKMCEDLAILIDRLFLELDPEVVVIGGGFAECGPHALEILRSAIVDYAAYSLYEAGRIDFSLAGNKAGIIGAAIFADQECSKRQNKHSL